MKFREIIKITVKRKCNFVIFLMIQQHKKMPKKLQHYFYVEKTKYFNCFHYAIIFQCSKKYQTEKFLDKHEHSQDLLKFSLSLVKIFSLSKKVIIFSISQNFPTDTLRRISVDSMSVLRRKEKIDEFPCHFDVLFLCNFDGWKITSFRYTLFNTISMGEKLT